jgi:predicted RecB family endonuclease
MPKASKAMKKQLILASVALLMVGCDNIAALTADPRAAQRIADAKAVGSACRFGLRSIEDCYALNEKSPKSAIFDGWKEMDQYMRENNIEGIPAKGLKALAAEDVIEEKASEQNKSTSNAKPQVKPKTGEK